MANLTDKELLALEDQLNFEHICQTKYEAAAAETAEPSLQNCFDKHARQHKQNFDTLMTFLQ